MAIKNSRPMKFTPKGVTDTFDASERFPGACQRLENLIFDQANPELVVSRPGVITLANFIAGGFLTPTFISLQAAIGPRIYGMVATSLNAGHDQPFIYDTSTGSFIAITGITGANTPVSPSQTGDWTPPTLAAVGTMVIVTHPGFSGAAGHFFGWFDVTNPAAPTWQDGNTATHALPAVPIAVANFNNRAFFAVGPTATSPPNQIWFTDVLTNPPTVTNADQFDVVGDQQPITALSGLPVTTTSSGIIGALTIFKATQLWQFTGDYTAKNTALVQVSLTIGTTSPRSVANCPSGLYFAGAGGPYLLDQLGIVRAVTNSIQGLDPDINVAFQNAQTPSRWAGAYIATTYRICGQTTLRGIGQFVDYWFDEHRRRWSGPHSYIYDCATAINGYFVLSSVNNPGQLVKSEPTPTGASVYTDLSSPTSFLLLSSTFPKTNEEMMKQVAESTIELAVTNGAVTYHIVAQNEQGGSLGEVDITVADGPIWDFAMWDVDSWGSSHTWGGGEIWGAPPVGSGAIWGAAQAIPHTYPVQWAAPLVFDKMQLQISGDASAAVGIGAFYARYQATGYQAWVAGAQVSILGTSNGV